jgi:hypothetical protein
LVFGYFSGHGPLFGQIGFGISGYPQVYTKSPFGQVIYGTRVPHIKYPMHFNFPHQPSGVQAAQEVEAHPIPFAPYT